MFQEPLNQRSLWKFLLRYKLFKRVRLSLAASRYSWPEWKAQRGAGGARGSVPARPPSLPGQSRRSWPGCWAPGWVPVLPEPPLTAGSHLQGCYWQERRVFSYRCIQGHEPITYMPLLLRKKPHKLDCESFPWATASGFLTSPVMLKSLWGPDSLLSKLYQMHQYHPQTRDTNLCQCTSVSDHSALQWIFRQCILGKKHYCTSSLTIFIKHLKRILYDSLQRWIWKVAFNIYRQFVVYSSLLQVLVSFFSSMTQKFLCPVFLSTPLFFFNIVKMISDSTSLNYYY